MGYVHFWPSVPNRPTGFGIGYVVTKSYTYPHNIVVTNIPREIATPQLVQHSGAQTTQSTSTEASHVKPKEKDMRADWLFVGDAIQHAPIPNPVVPPPVFSLLDVKSPSRLDNIPTFHPPTLGLEVNPLAMALQRRAVYLNQQSL